MYMVKDSHVHCLNNSLPNPKSEDNWEDNLDTTLGEDKLLKDDVVSDDDITMEECIKQKIEEPFAIVKNEYPFKFFT